MKKQLRKEIKNYIIKMMGASLGIKVNKLANDICASQKARLKNYSYIIDDSDGNITDRFFDEIVLSFIKRYDIDLVPALNESSIMQHLNEQCKKRLIYTIDALSSINKLDIINGCYTAFIKQDGYPSDWKLDAKTDVIIYEMLHSYLDGFNNQQIIDNLELFNVLGACKYITSDRIEALIDRLINTHLSPRYLKIPMNCKILSIKKLLTLTDNEKNSMEFRYIKYPGYVLNQSPIIPNPLSQQKKY